MGYEVTNEGIALEVSNGISEKVMPDLDKINEKGFSDKLSLASSVANKILEKYDNLLNESLQTKEYASRLIDVENSTLCIAQMIS
jgi:hypothetical protein